MKARVIPIALVMVLGSAAVGSGATVDVLDWALGTYVVDGSPSIPQVDSESSQTPQNPYMHTMSVSLGAEDTAVGAYDVSWMNDTGVFHLAAEQHLHGPERSASSNDNIHLTTTVDLVLNASGNMTFASTPGDEADFIYGLSVEATDPLMPYYSGHGRGGDSNLFTPASGSLAFESGDILLPGGHTYRVFLNFSSTSYSFLDQDPISANGEINFSWRPVPEPASAVFVGTLLSLVFGPRPRRRRR